MKYSYKTHGTCSQKIDIDIENGIINSVEFYGGCNGNLKGISAIVKGKNADEVIAAFDGIKCGFRRTSCPDQLARALKEALENDRD